MSALAGGLSARAAADVIWTLASERTYLALVRDRGWNAEAYERWLAHHLVAGLLARDAVDPPGDSHTRRSRR